MSYDKQNIFPVCIKILGLELKTRHSFQNRRDKFETYRLAFFFSLYLIMAFSRASKCGPSRSGEWHDASPPVIGDILLPKLSVPLLSALNLEVEMDKVE